MKTKPSPNHEPSTPWDKAFADAIQLPPAAWQERDYRPLAYIRPGLLIGAIAGCVSLLVNVIGSVFWPAVTGQIQHPLRLIQVYLTIPLGDNALQLESGYTLAFGSILYVATGMLYGLLIVIGISYVIPRADFEARAVFAVVASVALWLINFYLLLSWMQPLLFGGQWILQLIPWWVAALTHCIFGVTIAALYPLTARSAENAEVISNRGGANHEHA
jgi:hypothetical protein